MNNDKQTLGRPKNHSFTKLYLDFFFTIVETLLMHVSPHLSPPWSTNNQTQRRQLFTNFLVYFLIMYLTEHAQWCFSLWPRPPTLTIDFPLWFWAAGELLAATPQLASGIILQDQRIGPIKGQGLERHHPKSLAVKYYARLFKSHVFQLLTVF